MKSTTRRNHLGEWRTYRGLSQDEAAARAKTSKATISRLETGNRGVSQKWLERLATIYEATPAQLLASPQEATAAADEHANRVPLISSIQAGRMGDVVAPYPKGDARAWIPVMRRHGPRSFALEIDGPSMLPEYHERDVIIVDPDVEPRPGDDVVALQEDENTATFKRLRIKGYDPKGRPQIELAPLNPDWPVVTLKRGGKIVGVAVDLLRRLRR